MLDEAAIKQLIDDLRSEDWQIHQNAKDQLSAVSENKLIEIIIAALNSEERRIRVYLNSILYNIGESTVEPLLAALSNPRPLVRYEASYMLGMFFQEKRAIEPLIGLINDPELAPRQGRLMHSVGLRQRKRLKHFLTA